MRILSASVKDSVSSICRIISDLDWPGPAYSIWAKYVQTLYNGCLVMWSHNYMIFFTMWRSQWDMCMVLILRWYNVTLLRYRYLKWLHQKLKFACPPFKYMLPNIVSSWGHGCSVIKTCTDYISKPKNTSLYSKFILSVLHNLKLHQRSAVHVQRFYRWFESGSPWEDMDVHLKLISFLSIASSNPCPIQHL